MFQGTVRPVPSYRAKITKEKDRLVPVFFLRGDLCL